jgi:hypothetical protein
MTLARRTAAVISVIGLCAATGSAGYYLGKGHAADSTSAVLIGAGALDLQTVLRMIEGSDYEPARDYLNSAIDADVLQLDTLLSKTTDEAARKDMKRVLIVIADARRRAPAENDHPLAEVNEKVKAILESATRSE